jgi:regulator of sigma E protease
MDLLIKISQFVLSLSILIVLHELGHFIPARLFKIRVEKFYLFFDPWFSLFKVKKGGTEYGIGWLPLGGYVKISGMIDESMDKEQMAKPPQPWEFRSKPAWQRLIVMIGGVTVNVLLGIFIFWMVLFAYGEEFLPPQNLKYGVAVDSLGYKMGLRDGDMILSVNKTPINSIHKFNWEVMVNNGRTIEVQRDGKQITVPVTDDDISEMIKTKLPLIEPRTPFEIDSVLPGTPAAKAGIQKGDKVLSINGLTASYFQEAARILKKNKNETVDVMLLRHADTVHVKPVVSEVGTLGVMNKPLDKYLTFETKKYGFFASLPAGIHKAIETMEGQIQQFRILFTIKGAHKEIGGFGTMVKIFNPTWNWQSFWLLTALLSIVLAVMNILPIPALDGGHVMFLLYEVITRRKPSEKFLEYAQYVGMFILLSLFVYANGNDVIRWFNDQFF